ncbi:hypothetical protein HD806DRAFT_30004 [Xylariaceae sp. AK1471]|nr:hypothetical protein HD806DRAFT_30004 [Xylariaceae sp. AK1471]
MLYKRPTSSTADESYYRSCQIYLGQAELLNTHFFLPIKVSGRREPQNDLHDKGYSTGMGRYSAAIFNPRTAGTGAKPQNTSLGFSVMSHDFFSRSRYNTSIQRLILYGGYWTVIVVFYSWVPRPGFDTFAFNLTGIDRDIKQRNPAADNFRPARIEILHETMVLISPSDGWLIHQSINKLGSRHLRPQFRSLRGILFFFFFFLFCSFCFVEAK